MNNKFYLKSENIILRDFKIEDICEDYVSWLNDKDRMKYSNQRFLNHNYTSCLKYFNSFKNSSNKFIAIVEKDSNKLIGTITSYFNMNHKTVDLGILIGEKRVFGKGYGKESWKLYVDYLSTLKNIRKITAGTATCNKPMLNLIHSSKMIPDGIRKNHEIIENKEVDILYFAKFVNP